MIADPAAVAAIAAAISRVPALTGVDPSSATRLAGLQNVNYLLLCDADKYVLRIPGEGTSEYINRRHERVAAHAAAAAGVNAEVVFFDDVDGLMVTRFVDNAVTMTGELFRANPDAISRAGRVIRQLHDRSAPFATDFVLFPMIDEYKALLASKRATLPDGYDDVHRSATVLRDALMASPARLAPSHCDPLCENFLNTGERIYLIDYEFGGNNDPMWDLGDLSVEGGFSDADDAILLNAYFDGDPPVQQASRMVAYKALCDVLWTLWGVIQHANENPADDFWAYSVGRFERCQRLMATDEFADAVSVIANVT